MFLYKQISPCTICHVIIGHFLQTPALTIPCTYTPQLFFLLLLLLPWRFAETLRFLCSVESLIQFSSLISFQLLFLHFESFRLFAFRRQLKETPTHSFSSSFTTTANCFSSSRCAAMAFRSSLFRILGVLLLWILLFHGFGSGAQLLPETEGTVR